MSAVFFVFEIAAIFLRVLLCHMT